MKLIDKIFKKSPRVSVVRLHGVIASGGRIGSSNINDVSVGPLIERAFKKGKPKAVALSINSPGGSPVQSSLIGARIRRLADETGIPVYAFCQDVAASGGYWLATAADEIFVDKSSIVGSIGVISASFGFHELLEKQGIERRVYTAGEDKSMLDPFRPERAEDIERLKSIQAKIHTNFIEQVKSRRGDKLQGDNLFSGEIWIGEDAVKNGLVDDLGHLIPIMRDKLGEDVSFTIHGPKKGLLGRFRVTNANDLLGGIEDRAQWSKFGL